jgi:hypothetical protein
VPQVEQVVSSVYEINVNIIRVSPTVWPRLNQCEVISTVSEPALAIHDCDVTDSEMMLPPEARAEVLVRNAPLSVFFVLIVPLFLSNFVMMFVLLLPVLVLSQRSKRCREKE